MSRLLYLAALITLNLGCGPRPKPAELVSFEQIRLGDDAAHVRARFGKLTSEADEAYRRAIAAHDDNEPRETLQHTRLAAMAWRTATALSEAHDQRDALRAAEGRLTRAQDQLSDAKLRQSVARDAIARQARLVEMQAKLAKAERRARRDRAAASAKAKVDAAALQLKAAEQVDAARHAPGPFNKAQASLKLALEAFSKSDWVAASISADVAVTDALAAVAAAKPGFDEAARRRALDDRLKLMLEQTGAISGAEAHIERRGLVVRLRDLFPAGRDDLVPEMVPAVSTLAAIAVKETGFRIIVEGHTDNRGRSAKNLALSDRRATAITTWLTGAGVAAERITSLGKGDHEPVADNSNRAGRAQNRRVDVVFLRPTR